MESSKQNNSPVRINSGLEFQQVFRKGRRIVQTPWLTILALKQNNQRIRCGWAIPRQVGKAVFRNKLKRWTREWARTYPHGKSSCDLIFLFKANKNGIYENLTFTAYQEILGRVESALPKTEHKQA